VGITQVDTKTARWRQIRPGAILGVTGAAVLAIYSCGAVKAGGQQQGLSFHARYPQVGLEPPLTAGFGGWCLVTSESFGCMGERDVDSPIVAETTSEATVGTTAVVTGVAVTSRLVAAVKIGASSSSFATRAQNTLPDGMRAVAVEARSQPTQARQMLPRFTPLDANGGTMRHSNRRESLFFLFPAKQWRRPARQPSGPCTIRSAHQAGLSAQWGGVAETIEAHGDPIGGALLSCASTEFYFEGEPMLAAVLLNAEHPGAAPPPLPGMRPVAGHPSIFSVLGPEGPVMARRIRDAWLAVDGGTGAQRLTLLDRISATIRV